MGVNVGVLVAIAAGEGAPGTKAAPKWGAVLVKVGSGAIAVISSGAARDIKLHPSRDRHNPNVNINKFLIQLSCIWKLSVEFPENSQAVEGQPGGNDINNFSFFGNGFSQSTRGDDFHVAAQLRPKTGHHALNHAYISKD